MKYDAWVVGTQDFVWPKFYFKKFKKHSKINNMNQWEGDEEVQRLTDVQELNKQKLKAEIPKIN